MTDIHFEVTQEELKLILPLLCITLTAVVIFVVDFFRIGKDKGFAFHIAWAGILAAFNLNLFLLLKNEGAKSAFCGLVIVDRMCLVFNALIFISAFLTVLLSRNYVRKSKMAIPEYYAMLLFVVLGMLTISLANDLMVIFLGIELLSIPLYVLAAFIRNRRVSLEAGLKYFLMGAFASGFLLYGIVMLYGATGTTQISLLVTHVSGSKPQALVLCGFALITIGLAFKVAAVPFHMWAPDVYEGAPTPITAFMATGVKVAGFAAIIRIFSPLTLTAEAQSTLAGGAACLAVLSMLVGNLGALPQTNIKRMLAYSSIAHAGYLLVGISAGLATHSADAYRAVTYYLAAYVFMNVGAFGMVIFLRHRGEECNRIEDLSGLSRKHPGIALAMAIFMFTLAGLPPSAGFFGKFYLFKAAVDADMIGLAIFAVMMAVVSLFYYLRVITTMYLKPLKDESPEAEFCPFLLVATLISVLGVLFLGVIPGWGLDLLGTVF